MDLENYLTGKQIEEIIIHLSWTLLFASETYKQNIC